MSYPQPAISLAKCSVAGKVAFMAPQKLVQDIKRIVAFARQGKLEQAYEGYHKLFSDPAFGAYPPEVQRQALRLMVHVRRTTNIAPDYVVRAHRAAIAPLMELAGAHGNPEDFEMLGLCQVMVDDEVAAAVSFKAGLNIERARNPQSDLCGKLMKWVASV